MTLRARAILLVALTTLGGVALFGFGATGAISGPGLWFGLAAVGVVLAVVVWSEQRLLSRLALLSAQVRTAQVATQLDATSATASTHRRSRVHLDGSDELARLADAIETALSGVEQAEAELRGCNDELVRTDAIKDTFISTVSHELRSPLTSISGYTETVLGHWDRLEPAMIQELIGRVNVQGRALDRIVDDLLTLSRMQTGSIRLHPEQVLLRDNLVQTLAGVPGAEDVSITGDLDAQVVVDPDHLRRIVTNFVDNANKYGAGPVTITALAKPDDGEIELRVRDHGAGVPPEFEARLFERYTQASIGTRRTARGVGLGLSIVSMLADLNGGRVWHEPADPGACFVVRLPLEDEQPDGRQDTGAADAGDDLADDAHGHATDPEGARVTAGHGAARNGPVS